MHAHACTHSHTHSYICICMHAHTYTYVHTSIHTCTHSHTYVHTCTHAHRHICTYIYTRMHIHAQCMHSHAHALTYTHSARNPWYLILHAQALRSWEDASIVRHGKLQANLLPASGASKGLEMGHHMDPPAATLAVHVRSLSKERRQFLKSKLIVSNQIN